LSAADAMKAIKLCLDGAIDEGVALYAAVTRSIDNHGNHPQLPAGLHLLYLENAGLHDAANIIRRNALMAGLNVCIAAALAKPASEVVAGYRALFDQGVINSAMVADYLVQLSKLGRTAELNPFLDVDRLFSRTKISIGEGDEFWRSIAETLLQQKSDANLQRAVQSVRDMHNITLRGYSDIRIMRLLEEVHDRVSRYIADITGGEKAALPWVPQKFRLVPWALVSTGFGYNTPHVHRRGWITGVVYVCGPDEIGADGHPVGALRVGAPKAVENAAGWPDMVVAPKPGTLVLVPSYFTHWTTPLGRPGLRISIAFDVEDLR
jgi:putative 2-oxoglutarate-Fe(II)-dependent oxygenase superfamily protein